MSSYQSTKTAFVTGGTGFVGSTLIEYLIKAGWDVTALCRASSDKKKLSGLPVRFVEGDITQLDSLRQVFPAQPDAVFHIAANMNMWSLNNAMQTRVNVDGTKNMVKLALESDARRFILTSTAASFGSHNLPISEGSPSYGGNSWINYIRTKWLAEQEVYSGIKLGLDGVIICPSAILGPRDTHGWARLFFQIKDGALKAIPPGTATFNHINDVAKAHISAVANGEPGSLYLLPGEVASFADMIKIMAEIMDVEIKARIIPASLLKVMANAGNLVAKINKREPDLTPEMATVMSLKVIINSSKAECDLGYKKTPLRTCVEDSYYWLKDNGYLS